VSDVERTLRQAGYSPCTVRGQPRTRIGAIGGVPGDRERLRALQQSPAVESIVPFAHPFPRASRQLHPHDTVVAVAGTPIGGRRIAVMAGPCTVETREQLLEVAQGVKAACAALLRGGAYKPRTLRTRSRDSRSRGSRCSPRRMRPAGCPW
jgi:3-deoxy-7-phosphoheptulonate synthase